MDAARSMYAAQPSDDDLRAVGLFREDVEVDSVEIWPDNLPSLQVFLSMSTQWRVGMSGPTGLDYGVLPAVLDMENIPLADRQAVFNDVRVMERAALDEIYRDR